MISHPRLDTVAADVQTVAGRCIIRVPNTWRDFVRSRAEHAGKDSQTFKPEDIQERWCCWLCGSETQPMTQFRDTLQISRVTTAKSLAHRSFRYTLQNGSWAFFLHPSVHRGTVSTADVKSIVTAGCTSESENPPTMELRCISTSCVRAEAPAAEKFVYGRRSHGKFTECSSGEG